MNKELIESLNVLEKEKEISKEVLFEAIENSLVVAYKKLTMLLLMLTEKQEISTFIHRRKLLKKYLIL